MRSFSAAALVVSVLALTPRLCAAAGPSGTATAADTCMAAAELSQPLRRDGKLLAAREQLLACARPECPAFVKADCAQWLTDLEASIPTLVIRGHDDEGRDVADATVSMDGRPLAARLDGKALTIDPGEHTFRFERAGSATIEERLVIRQGERNRPLAVTFRPAGSAAAGAAGAAGAASAPAGATPIATTAAPEGPEGRGAVPVASWVLGGASVVAMGAGAFFWISGSSEHSDMQSSCAPLHACAQADVDAARTKLIVGDIAFAAGLVMLVPAAYLAITARHAKAHVDVRPTAGGGTVSFATRF